MKNFSILMGVMLLSVCRINAQIEVEVVLDQEQFLPGEKLMAGIRISNRSGQTITLGADEAWLRLIVEAQDKYIVGRLGELPVKGEFSLESAERGTRRVDLQPYFELMNPGRYQVSAVVHVKEFERSFTSPPKTFDIVAGTKLWEQEVGVPGSSPADGGMPEMRRYILHQANYLKRQLVLYVRVTDSSGKWNKVMPLGGMLSFSNPEAQVDRFNNLHVLYQSGPRSCSYFMINLNGELLARQLYEITSRPKLKMDESGRISVMGGARQFRPDDLPAQPLPNSDATTPER